MLCARVIRTDHDQKLTLTPVVFQVSSRFQSLSVISWHVFFIFFLAENSQSSCFRGFSVSSIACNCSLVSRRWSPDRRTTAAALASSWNWSNRRPSRSQKSRHHCQTIRCFLHRAVRIPSSRWPSTRSSWRVGRASGRWTLMNSWQTFGASTRGHHHPFPTPKTNPPTITRHWLPLDLVVCWDSPHSRSQHRSATRPWTRCGSRYTRTRHIDSSRHPATPTTACSRGASRHSVRWPSRISSWGPGFCTSQLCLPTPNSLHRFLSLHQVLWTPLYCLIPAMERGILPVSEWSRAAMGPGAIHQAMDSGLTTAWYMETIVLAAAHNPHAVLWMRGPMVFWRHSGWRVRGSSMGHRRWSWSEGSVGWSRIGSQQLDHGPGDRSEEVNGFSFSFR